MTKQTTWKRPEEIVTFHTSDPKQMLGKFLPKRLCKTWTEDFLDKDTGEITTVERSQVLMERGELTNERVSLVMFHIQAGDIDGVDVCDENVAEMVIYNPDWYYKFNVEILADGFQKLHYVVFAQNIPQAITIATEFGQVYRHLQGLLQILKVVKIDGEIIPDDHPCIPVNDQLPAEDPKPYFKVTVRHLWSDDDNKPHREDRDYIINANEVGEAKERIARYIDIYIAEKKAEGVPIDPEETYTIRKAMPFEVDCIVPREYSELYKEQPTQ